MAFLCARPCSGGQQDSDPAESSVRGPGWLNGREDRLAMASRRVPEELLLSNQGRTWSRPCSLTPLPTPRHTSSVQNIVGMVCFIGALATGHAGCLHQPDLHLTSNTRQKDCTRSATSLNAFLMNSTGISEPSATATSKAMLNCGRRCEVTRQCQGTERDWGWGWVRTALVSTARKHLSEGTGTESTRG